MSKFDLNAATNQACTDINNFWNQNSSSILVVSGVVGLIGSGILACINTFKAPKILDKQKIEIEKIRAAREDDILDDQQYRKAITKEYFKCSLEWVKLYAPSVIIASLSAGMVFESNDILKKKNASLAAAYTTLDGAFKAYRGRVIDKYGKDEDTRLLTGAHEEEIVEETVTEDGKKKKVKRKVNVLDPMDIENWCSYARIMGRFPEESQHHCTQFVGNDRDVEYNKAQAEAVQGYLNDRLYANGFVTLNEVYEELGFKLTKAGQCVGWVKGQSQEGDAYIDLGIDDQYWYRNSEGDLSRGILINPNCHDIREEMPIEDM